jgi:peroxiredoxin
MKYFAAIALGLLFVCSGFGQAAPPSRPTFSTFDISGQKIDTAALAGKVVVLNLWFVNCPNCVEEIGMLNGLVDEYKDRKDVVFIGLAASSKPMLVDFLSKHPFKYTIVPNAQMIILGKFGAPDKNGDIEVPFPMHVVLDRTGVVIARAQGSKGIGAVRAALTGELAKKTAATP